MLYESEYYGVCSLGDSLAHHGIPKQKWGVRRFQYEDGSLTPAGRERYGVGTGGSAIGGAAYSLLTERKLNPKSIASFAINDMVDDAILSGKFDGLARRKNSSKELAKSNASLAKKGDYNFKDDAEGTRLKNAASEASKKFHEVRKVEDDFLNNPELVRKYSEIVANKTWNQAVHKLGWNNTPEGKKEWIDRHVSGEFDQNHESFAEYMRDKVGKDGYSGYMEKVAGARRNLRSAVDKYVDHALGDLKDTKIKDLQNQNWDPKKRKWVPTETTLKRKAAYKINMDYLQGK